MLSSESDLFQEQSIDEGLRMNSQECVRENSIQFLFNHNQSFFSQQSNSSDKSTFLLNEEVTRTNINTNTKKNVEQYCSNLPTPMSINAPQKAFAKNQSNKMVIISSKKMKKQTEIVSNTSLTNFGCLLGSQETVESDDNKSESTEENVKIQSFDKIQREEEEETLTNFLEKRFISPRTLNKYHTKNPSMKQDPSQCSPSKFTNLNDFLVLQRNPRIMRLSKINSYTGQKQQFNQRDLSFNERLHTEPVDSRSNTPLSGCFNGSKQIFRKKQQNRSNSVNVTYLKTDQNLIQQQFANEKRRILSHNMRSNSTVGHEKIPASLLRKEIDNLIGPSTPQRVRTEASPDTHKNQNYGGATVLVMNPRNMTSPLRRRQLLQPVKIQSKQNYEMEAMELIKYYDNNNPTTNQITFVESPSKSIKGSPVKANKKFNESLFKLSNQITQMEKSMLSSYYKDFIRITPV